MWREALLGAAAVGSACLLRSEYEKKHFSVEETEIFSPKIQKDRVFVFCLIFITMSLDQETAGC